MNKTAAATNELQEYLRRWKHDAIGRQYYDDVHGVVILEELCQNGADLKYLERERGFALISSVFWSKNLIQFFLDKGMDVNSRDENGDTALHLAIRHTEFEQDFKAAIIKTAIKCLIFQTEADPNITNLRGETALFTLAKWKTYGVQKEKKFYIEKVAKMLLDRGVDMTICNEDGESVLHLGTTLDCINYDFIQVFRGDIDFRTSNWLYSQTPLMGAAREGRLEICRLLVKTRGVDVNARDLQGYTALHHAVRNLQYKCAKFLIKVGADPSIKSSSGRDVYAHSIIQGHRAPYSRVFTSGATPTQLVEILEIEGAMNITNYMGLDQAFDVWDEAREICKKFHLQPSPEFLTNYKFLRMNLDRSNPEAIERIVLSARNTIDRLSRGNNKLWNLLAGYFYNPSSFLFLFDVDLLIPQELKHFASLETTDFYYLFRLVEIFESNNQLLATKTFRFFVHLTIASFNKLIHERKSRKVSSLCMVLYVRLCHALTRSLHSQTSIISENAGAFINDNKRLLRTLIYLDIRDGDDLNSPMHLILNEFEPELAGALLNFDFVSIDVKYRNRMGYEPVQTIDWNKYNRPFSQQFLDVLVKLADRGAHVDARNASCDQVTLKEVFEENDNKLSFKYDSLQCACARVLARSLVPFTKSIPKHMVEFIYEHM